MTKPIELIASTANWLSHASHARQDNRRCMIPSEQIFDIFCTEICYPVAGCDQCPHWKNKNTTEIVNVLYRSFK